MRILSFVFLSFTALSLAGCGVPAAQVPSGYAEYSLPDKSVDCVSPNGWARSQSAGGGGTISGADFTSGAAKIVVFSDLQGSLMADMSTASNNQMDSLSGALPTGMQMNLPKTVPAIEKLYKIDRRSVAKKFQNYDETAMQTLQSPLGEGRIGEFTGEQSALFKTIKYHGLRVTLLSGERHVTVTCSCPESEWKTLRPAFSKVLRSLKAGSS